VDEYQEMAPAAAARGLLTCVWSRRVAPAETGARRIVPDACVDVIWQRESGQLFVAGPDTRAHLTRISSGEMVGARFHTGRSSVALGVPAHALRDERVDLGELWEPSRVAQLGDALAATPSMPAAQAAITDAVVVGVRTDPDPAVPTLLSLAGRGTRIAAMADHLGITERQLHRRCLAAFGYGAKVLQRVLRFDRALRLARSGMPPADIAYGLGYADQAHLSREVRALAGVPLGTLLSA
jgi:AraC-like DNA-binding protein